MTYCIITFLVIWPNRQGIVASGSSEEKLAFSWCHFRVHLLTVSPVFGCLVALFRSPPNAEGYI